MGASETERQHGRASRLIMVGVDGSDPSIGALRWAVDEARRSDTCVEAIYVYANPSQATWYVGGHPGVLPPDRDAVIRSARSELDRAVRRAIQDPPPVPITTVVVPHQTAAEGLIDAATRADMLVIGTHHTSGVGRLFGSTSAHVLRHAPCPVVVIPGAADADLDRSDEIVPTNAVSSQT